MSDVTIFALIFGGLFVLRIIAATIVFFYILPRGDRCPNCDAVTLRVQSAGWNRVLPWLRTSWCYVCGWEGMLRHGDLTPEPTRPSVKKGTPTA
jgi:hypothetical protein